MTICLIATVRLIVETLEVHTDLTWKLLGSFPKDYTRMCIVPDTYRQLSIKICKCKSKKTLPPLMMVSSLSKVSRNLVQRMYNGLNKTIQWN